MTVSSLTNRNQYTSVGSAGPYSYNFRIFNAEDLLVTVLNLNTGIETTLTYITDYTITGVGNLTGGTITLISISLAPTGRILTLRRVLTLLQETDIANQGPYFPRLHEDAFDRSIMIDQQQQDEIDRSLKFSESTDFDDVDTSLPEPEPFAVLVWNATGTALENRLVDDGSVILPGDGRTVTSLTEYLSNNALINVRDYGAGLGSNDNAALQECADIAAAMVSAGTVGACVYIPAGTTCNISTQITSIDGVRWIGAGDRASRIVSSYVGYAIKFGRGTVSLAYGCAIEHMSINMTNINGHGIWAIGTAGFYADHLYIEGYLNGNSTAVFLDGGNTSNIFTRLNAIICNHIHKGLVLSTTGSSYVTSVNSVGFSALCDSNLSNKAGSIGIQVLGVSGQGSTFVGGNIEFCEVGISVTGVGCTFVGVRFESGSNDTDLLLNINARGNVFSGCNGWLLVTNNSGNTTNKFSNNIKGDGSWQTYPNDTLSALASLSVLGTITLGAAGLAAITQGDTGVIADNAIATIPISGHCFRLTVTETGNNTAADFLLAPSAGIAIAIAVQTSALFTVTATTANKINVYYSAGNINIENKTGAPTTVYYLLTQVRN